MMMRIGLPMLLAGVCCIAACEQDETPGGGKSPTTQAADESDQGVSLDDVARSAKETLATAIEYARQKKEAYQKRIEPELARLDERIEQMKKKLTEAADEARPELEKRIEELSEKARIAREKLDRVKEASGEAWEEARRGLDDALQELRDALDEGAAESQPTEPERE